MTRYISGRLKCEISFGNVIVDDGQDEMNAIFPNGFLGEMRSEYLTIEEDYEEE